MRISKFSLRLQSRNKHREDIGQLKSVPEQNLIVFSYDYMMMLKAGQQSQLEDC